jgi:hypothetical protein
VRDVLYYFILLRHSKNSPQFAAFLFSVKEVHCVLCSSLPRTVCHVQHFLTFLFIYYYAALCSIPLLEHYASQRIFLAIRVHSHTIHSIRNRKYTVFRFGIPPYQQQYTTFISHHLCWSFFNTTSDRERYTLYRISSPSIRLYHIFSSILRF